MFGLNQQLTVNVVSLKRTEEPPDRSSDAELAAVAGERGICRVSLLAGSLTAWGVAPVGSGEITRLATTGPL